MSFKIFLLYSMAWSFAALSPGPAVMCSMAQSTRYGFRSSLSGISGIQVGSSLVFICVALGLRTLATNGATVLAGFRMLGAGYLFYLGVCVIGSSFRRTDVQGDQPASSFANKRLFLQGLVVQSTNPKAFLFMSALLPQFIDPRSSLTLQLTIFLGSTIAIDTFVLSAYAYFAQQGIQFFRASRFSDWLERVFGAALFFFGLRLLVSRNDTAERP